MPPRSQPARFAPERVFRLERPISHAQFYYDHGQSYPYDGDEDGDWAVKAARGVLADLCDRRDIKRGLEHVDEEVRREIVDALAGIIRLGWTDKRDG